MTYRVVMESGRVYYIEKYETKKYRNGWIHYEDVGGDEIISLRKDNVEAEIWQDDDAFWTQERVNRN